MADLIAAAKQALEALEADNSKLWPSDRRTAAYFNLRAALAQAEPAQTFKEWIATDEGITRFGMQLRPEWVNAARAGWNAAKAGGRNG